MIFRRLAVALLYAGGASVAAAQTVTIASRGSEPGTEILPAALQGPHTTSIAGSSFTVAAGTTVDRSLIVIGHDAIVAGTVHGDVIVVNGGLYLHPGAVIDGRAIAIGSNVYNATLAHTGSPPLSIHDFTYDVSPIPDGVSLSYRSTAQAEDSDLQGFSLPGFFGLVLPAYDRADGLSLPVAGLFVAKRLSIEPRIIARSQLGRVDPWLDVVDSVGVASAFSLSGGRNTFSNDEWFRSNIVNSLETIGLGNDARNYFRGTRGDAKYAWQSDTGETYHSLYIGVRGEHALTVRPGVGVTGGPWSFFGRHGDDDMLRPNPAIDNGVTKSLRAGVGVFSPASDIHGHATLGIELGRFDGDTVAGIANQSSRDFAQATFDGIITFPTFGDQYIQFNGHAVASSHGGTPRQRWAYLGGSGTLPTFDLFQFGGDQLVYLEGHYNLPITSREIPLLGPPTIALHDAIGGAGVGSIKTLHQNIGARLSFGPIYIGFVMDPATRHWNFDGGFSLLR